MKKLLLFGILAALNSNAANETNLPAIADKPWTTNVIRSSSALATNTPSAGQALLSDGSTNYWGTVSSSSSTNQLLAFGAMSYGAQSSPMDPAYNTFSNFWNSGSFNVAINTNTGIYTISNAGWYELSYNINAKSVGPFTYVMNVKSNTVNVDTYYITLTNDWWTSASRSAIYYMPSNSTWQVVGGKSGVGGVTSAGSAGCSHFIRRLN